MMPEIGNGLLCLALGIALLLSVYPLWGVARGDARMMASSRLFAWLLFMSVAGAFLVLVNAFVVNDFTVTYVASNSNTQLPVWYRVAATWGAHEGSLLLWVLLMSGWTFAVAIFSQRIPLDIVARVLAIMGMVSVGFLLFILFTSNPFSRTLPNFPIEGRDLNPLLQDPGLIFHPPLLYMGYVGFSVAFAFAIASLLSGRLDSTYARFTRPWTLAAWIFLTLGIVLGSAWAYYELGWGGWWFWDPVENASFMPWLVGTALMHSLAVTEQRASFKAWTLLLAISAFSLCLLGTFLVRSGVLVSVHAFASDPARGMFILAFMVLVIGGSGSGKTRFFVKPNLMQCVSEKYPCSFVVTDPKGSLIVECGRMLRHFGYRIKVMNTINFAKSMHYNPLAYIHSEKDILKLVNCLIANTRGEGKGGDPFWEKSEVLLYTALIGYLWQEALEEERNFATLIDMIGSMQTREDNEDFRNPIDLMFEDLEREKPDCFAVRQYKKFKLAAGVVCSKYPLNHEIFS